MAYAVTQAPRWLTLALLQRDIAWWPYAGASKHLWLGNLNTRLPRAVLKAVFEVHGPVDDVVTFPGRMYAFVNFQHADDAARAQEALDGKEVRPSLCFRNPLPFLLPGALTPLPILLTARQITELWPKHCQQWQSLHSCMHTVAPHYSRVKS